ncbi:hypothetical protein [Cerasicoccus frondis]|uniref:hypothetical protein n=1 Tax=Cerasicoccus frondis TaxID=490090 RepID=UPI002852D9B6|nr:hypothetical protein [Cerasicoccus frondis]
MQKPDSEETEKVTLEDLLRLKQQERPDDAYWARFERELHAKPWQKMVNRTSWWRRAWIRLQDSVHPALPVASTAAMALAGYWGVTMTSTAELSPGPATQVEAFVAETEAPAPQSEPVATAEIALPQSANQHFVVGSFSSTASQDPAFTTVAATHYMPASQRDGVHFATNAIDTASHASLAMATGPVRSIY